MVCLGSSVKQVNVFTNLQKDHQRCSLKLSSTVSDSLDELSLHIIIPDSMYY